MSDDCETLTTAVPVRGIPPARIHPWLDSGESLARLALPRIFFVRKILGGRLFAQWCEACQIHATDFRFLSYHRRWAAA